MDILSNTTKESTNCIMSIFIQHSCSVPHGNRIPGAFLQHWASAANSADLHLASSGCDGASPVYHNRRGFRSTPSAALVNSTEKLPPRPRHRPLAKSWSAICLSTDMESSVMESKWNFLYNRFKAIEIRTCIWTLVCSKYSDISFV